MIPLVATLLGATQARAAIIDVVQPLDKVALADGCSLREAINAINNHAPSGDCPAANSGDTIRLKTKTYVVNSPLRIYQPLSIVGRGSRSTLIKSNFSNASELFEVGVGSATSATTIFRDLAIDSGGGAPGLTGIYTHASQPDMGFTLVGCRVAGFTWGGIYAVGVDVLVQDSDIDSNYSPDAGGGIAVFTGGSSVGSLNVESSSVTWNYSDDVGGGLYSEGGGNSHLLSSTVAENSASQGGGLYLWQPSGGYFEINSSTIAGNAADYGGGLVSANSASYYTYSSIIANNWAQYDGSDYYGRVVDLIDSLVEDRSTLSVEVNDVGNIVWTDPLLNSVLVSLGGSRPTYAYRLLSGSPAIDVIASMQVTDDQGHRPRGIDGNGVPSSAFDMGAVEYSP